MKLSINTDLTKLSRAGHVAEAADAAVLPPPFDTITLEHDERHLRRKVLTLQHGEKVHIDLPEATLLSHGDRLVLEDGRNVEIIAAEEPLYEVHAGSHTPIRHLAWHLGNRHLAAQIEDDRILIRRDHVIRDMLLGLGAEVTETNEPFQPLHGAYHGHGYDHGQQAEAWGRKPGDPHYGHYHGPHEPHGHVHDEHHHDQHDHGRHHDHDHGKLDKFGRKSGDPHYGHNHD